MTRKRICTVVTLGLLTSAAASGAGATPITLAELQSITYRGIDEAGGDVTLSAGRWQGPPVAPDSATRPEVELVPDLVLSGDLDADGTSDAVALLRASAGGSGTYLYAAAVLLTSGALENVATVLVGDRVQVRSGRIEGGRILLSVVRAGQGDPSCCPGEIATLGWTLGQGSKLEPLEPADVGRLGLQALAGPQWVLRWWNDDEPAPPTPEVTLSADDTRIAGSSGCNRYTTGAASQELASEIRIGPIAATRRMCPPEIMAVEDRFLALLAKVQRFGFRFGRLALTYTQGDRAGTLIFDSRPSGSTDQAPEAPAAQ